MFTNTTTPLLTDIKITRRQKHLCITGLCCVKFYLNCYRVLYTWRKAQVHSAVRLNSKAAAPPTLRGGKPLNTSSILTHPQMLQEKTTCPPCLKTASISLTETSLWTWGFLFVCFLVWCCQSTGLDFK